MAVLALVLGFAGCDAGAPEAPGAIVGQVQGEGTPLAGVTVELTGALNRVTTTDSQGRYGFDEVPTGAYVVSIRNLPADAAFPAVSRTASVTAGSTISLDFVGNFIRTASISGRVLARGQGVAGVTVSLTGPESASRVTGADGSFTFPALRAGAYEVNLSGIPSSLSFASTRSTVDLQPGQDHVVQFDGDPETTASVAVRGVNRVLPGGVREPADLREIRGLIEVLVTLDRGEDTVDSVTVRLGSTVVGTQRFGSTGAAPTPAALNGTTELLFSVQTDAFQSSTGIPLHLNGETLLTVTLATREGGAEAFVASVQLDLDNRDTFAVELLPARGPVADTSGALWVGGTLEARVIPVLYTPGRTVNSVTLELRGSAGNLVARSGTVGNPPLLVRFPSEPGLSGSVAGYVTPEGTVDRLLVSQAQYAGGGAVPGLPRVASDSLRIDQAAPTAEAFELPRQGPDSRCCLESWVGAEFAFGTALRGLADAGVGGSDVRVHAGAASLSNAQLRALPPVVRGSDLPESSGNTTYRAIAVLEDALGNQRVVPLAPSPGNPTVGEAGALFGVDRTAPVATLASGGGTLPAQSTNPPPGSAWGFTVTDGGSGVGPLPLLVTIRRFGPGDPPEGTCLDLSPEAGGGSGTCDPQPSGLLRPVPDVAGGGYVEIVARGVDRGGNLSAPVVARVLRDQVAPMVPGFFLATPLVGGSEARVVLEATDDVDLARARLLARFGTEGGGEDGAAPLDLPAHAPVQALGTPFSGNGVRGSSAQFGFTHVHGVQGAGSGSSGSAAGGPVLPLTRFRGQVEDAAGNRAERVLEVPPPAPSALHGFEEAARGASAVQQWTAAAGRSVICPPAAGQTGGPGNGAGCPQGTAGPVELSATVRLLGAEGLPSFTRVHFVLVGEESRWIGSSAQPEERTVDGVRSWRWSIAWDPPEGLIPGTSQLQVVGVDAEGNGLVSLNPAPVGILAR